MYNSPKNARSFNVSTLIVLHLLIVIPLAYYLNIWADEASTLYTTQNGIFAALQNAASDERQAPLYFWIMSLWRSINGSIFFARLFSIICGVVSIRLFAGLAQRLFSFRAALLATAFFALHPIMIWASLEIRVYSLVILLSIALIRLFLNGFFDIGQDKSLITQRIARIWFFVISVVALYTNYYLGFLLVGLFAALLATRRWRDARDYIGAMFVTGIAFLPIIFTVKSQFVVNTSTFHDERTLVDGLRRIWGHMLTFILPADFIAATESTNASVIRLWIVRAAILVTGFFAFRRRDRIQPQTMAFAAITAAISVCLLVAYFMVGSWLVALRHASVLFVPLILFIASLLNDIFVHKDEKKGINLSRFIAPVFGILVLASFSYAIMTLYPNMAKRGDWARVGAYIEQNEAPNQPIIIFHTFDALVLPYHYHGVNKIFPDERYFDFDFASPGPALTRSRTDFTISKIPPDAAEIWLIVNNECDEHIKCEQLESFIQSHYDIVKEQNFYLQTVTLLKKRSP